MKNAVSFGFQEFWHKFLVFLGIESLSEMNKIMTRMFVLNVVEYLQDRGCTLSSDKLTVIMNDLINDKKMTFDQKIDALYSKVKPYGYSSSRTIMYADAISGTKYFLKQEGEGVSLNSNSSTLNQNDVQEPKKPNLSMDDKTYLESLSQLTTDYENLSSLEFSSRLKNLDSARSAYLDEYSSSSRFSNKVEKLNQEKNQKSSSNERTV